MVFIYWLLFLIFPGQLLVYKLDKLSGFQKMVLTIAISSSFWIISPWFIHLFQQKLNILAIIFQLIFVFIFAVQNWKRFSNIILGRAKYDFSLKSFFSSNGNQFYFVSIGLLLLFSVGYLCVPFLFTLPPGCDISMHGYVTKLIFNQNGLPTTYRPILPVDYFGSYSSGYHCLTYFFSSCSLESFLLGIQFVTGFSYIFCLLAIIFLFNFFYDFPIAVIAGISCFAINHTISGTIGWGGNPTILAFAFCLITITLVLKGLDKLTWWCFLAASFPFAAACLTHLIPFVGMIYLFLPIFAISFLRGNKKLRVGILFKLAGFGLMALFLLFPFFLNFKVDHSVLLKDMIKSWQFHMMSDTLSGHLFSDILPALGQVKYRMGDAFFITICLSTVIILLKRKFLQLGIYWAVISFFFVLILNTSIWFLPLSELLYPERIVFFLIVTAGLLICELLLISAEVNIFLGKLRIRVFPILVSLLLLISLFKFNERYFSPQFSNSIRLDNSVKASFNWLEMKTPNNSIIESTYGDIGMWIPAFTNRASTGAHLHFIHIVNGISDSLALQKGPRYYFITPLDSINKTKIFIVAKDFPTVFQSGRIKIKAK